MTAVRPGASFSSLRYFLQQIPHGLFSLVYPDECRVCEQPLRGFTRVPVCAGCLGKPEPLCAEFFCAQCRTPFQNEFPLDEHGRCGLCRNGMRYFDAAYCYGDYEGNLRTLIHLYKYRHIRSLDKPLGALLANALPRESQFDAVVPVPLHWRRRWSRGFNQSALLGKAMARRCGVPLRNALMRGRATEAQATLTNAQRRKNVAGAFRVRPGRPVQGLRILLVDDVMTTGATGNACAYALRRAGAKSVTLLTLARVDRRLAAPSAGRKAFRSSLDGCLDEITETGIGTER